MTNGFKGDSGKGKAKVTINVDEVNSLIKKYKNIKKYMRSNIFELKTMYGTETIVSELLKEIEDDPPDI